MHVRVKRRANPPGLPGLVALAGLKPRRLADGAVAVVRAHAHAPEVARAGRERQRRREAQRADVRALAAVVEQRAKVGRVGDLNARRRLTRAGGRLHDIGKGRRLQQRTERKLEMVRPKPCNPHRFHRLSAGLRPLLAPIIATAAAARNRLFLSCFAAQDASAGAPVFRSQTHMRARRESLVFFAKGLYKHVGRCYNICRSEYAVREWRNWQTR